MNKFLVICILLASLSIIAQATASNKRASNKASNKPKNVIPGSWGSGKKFINVQRGLKVMDKSVSFGTRYTVKFDYKVPAKNDPAWVQFFRVTYSNKDCCGKNDRLLAVWIKPKSTQLLFALNAATPQKGNNTFYTPDFTPGQTYKIKFVVYDNRMILYVNYKPVKSQFQGNNSSKTTGSYGGRPYGFVTAVKNADLYIGDKFYKAAGDGVFKKLRIFDAPMFLADNLCDSQNVMGHLRRNQWFQGVRDYSPCANMEMNLPNKYTLQFQYKIGAKYNQYQSIFRFSKTRGNSSQTDRPLDLYLVSNQGARPALLVASKKSNAANTLARHNDFKEGDIIDIKIIVDKKAFFLVINNQIAATQYYGEIKTTNNVRFYAGNRYYPPANGMMKRLTLTPGKALYPHTQLCKSNPFGPYGRNRWSVPERGIVPCPSERISLGRKYTFEFDYWPIKKHSAWLNIMQLMPFGHTQNCCGSTTRRQPAIFVWPNRSTLHFRVSSTGSANGGIDSSHTDFVFGEKYRVKLVVDVDRIYYFINGELKRGAKLKPSVYTLSKGLAWTTNTWYVMPKKFAFQTKRMKLTKSVKLPGSNLCSNTNPWGIYSGNRPTKPIRGFKPCSSQNQVKIGSTYTVKFKYLPIQTVSGDKNLFSFLQWPSKPNRQQAGQVLNVMVRSNSFDLAIWMMRNNNQVQSYYPKFDFKSDVSYAIRIQVVNGKTTTIFVDDREIFTANNGSFSGSRRQLSHLYVNDDYTTSPNVQIYKASIRDGLGTQCIKIYSECNFQGQSTSVCDSNQNLKDSGWNYPVKSVKIPAGFENKVILHTQTDYNGEKLVLTKDKKCIKSDHYSFLQVPAQVEAKNE